MVRPPLSHTHTYAILDVAPATFADIKARIGALGREYVEQYLQREDGEELIVFGTVALQAEKTNHQGTKAPSTEKKPRLFYWEDAENCWAPVPDDEVPGIINTDNFSES